MFCRKPNTDHQHVLQWTQSTSMDSTSSRARARLLRWLLRYSAGPTPFDQRHAPTHSHTHTCRRLYELTKHSALLYNTTVLVWVSVCPSDDQSFTCCHQTKAKKFDEGAAVEAPPRTPQFVQGHVDCRPMGGVTRYEIRHTCCINCMDYRPGVSLCTAFLCLSDRLMLLLYTVTLSLCLLLKLNDDDDDDVCSYGS